MFLAVRATHITLGSALKGCTVWQQANRMLHSPDLLCCSYAASRCELASEPFALPKMKPLSLAVDVKERSTDGSEPSHQRYRGHFSAA